MPLYRTPDGKLYVNTTDTALIDDMPCECDLDCPTCDDPTCQEFLANPPATITVNLNNCTVNWGDCCYDSFEDLVWSNHGSGSIDGAYAVSLNSSSPSVATYEGTFDVTLTAYSYQPGLDRAACTTVDLPWHCTAVTAECDPCTEEQFPTADCSGDDFGFGTGCLLKIRISLEIRCDVNTGTEPVARFCAVTDFGGTKNPVEDPGECSSVTPISDWTSGATGENFEVILDVNLRHNPEVPRQTSVNFQQTPSGVCAANVGQPGVASWSWQ